VPVAARRAAPEGGELCELWRMSREKNGTSGTSGTNRTGLTSFIVRRSDCREFVANHADVRGGAVPPLAYARSYCAIGAGVACPDTLHPGDADLSPGTLDAPAPSVQLVRCQRFSRLCVLMNPILPGSRSIRTWPAKCLKLILLRSGQIREMQEVNL
jgi:hypothetical protein